MFGRKQTCADCKSAEATVGFPHRDAHGTVVPRSGSKLCQYCYEQRANKVREQVADYSDLVPRTCTGYPGMAARNSVELQAQLVLECHISPGISSRASGLHTRLL